MSVQRVNETYTMKKIVPRITAIDFVRGLAIILMALDHASTYWNSGRFFGEFWFLGRPEFWPDLLQYLIRFVSHWCAPTFVFLAGTSLILSETRRLEKGEAHEEITKHLVVRGLILLVIEWTLIAWLFQAEAFYFGVLAAIGVGFIVFAFARKLTTKIILGISLFIVLDDIFAEFIFNPLFQPGFHPVSFTIFYIGAIFEPIFGQLIIPFTSVPFLSWLQAATYNPIWPYGLYSLDPWLGVMGLGVVFGRWLLQQQEKSNANHHIAKRLTLNGAILLITFFINRTFQGTPTNFFPIWVADGVLMENAFAIQNYFFMSKYPPSISFLLWTLGGMFLALGVAYYLQDNDLFLKLAKPVILFGTTALFFYCTHLMLYGAIPLISGLMKSFSVQITLLVWVLGLLILYPVCIEFHKLKKRHPNSLLKYI